MDTTLLKSPTDWFRVHSFRNLDDPIGQLQRKEMVVSLDQYPYGFGLGPNPRRPDLTSKVSKAIEETLNDDGEHFHLLNRGITIVAKAVDYDNKTERVRLHLHEAEDEERFYGILDGGNTDKRINKWREDLDDDLAPDQLALRFVNVQVLIPKLEGVSIPTGEMVELMNDVKQARNTSVQVKQKSLADSKMLFEALKSVLSKEAYFPEISWREGEKGSIDGLLVVGLLMTYYPSFSASSPQKEPNGAYGRKERCLEAFLEFADEERDLLRAWTEITPRILQLFDEIYFQLPEHYSGYFGKINEVAIFDEKRAVKGNKKKYRKAPARTPFFGQSMKYTYPSGWIYPLFAAFRVLVAYDPTLQRVVWKRDPIEFWNQHAKEIVERYEPFLSQAGYEPKKIASNAVCYQSMKTTVMDLYKGDLLRAAGIES